MDTAYAQLCAEGYIESKPKRGFFVCQVEELAELHIPVKIEEEEEEIRPEKIPYDFHQQELIWNSFLIISGENC